MEQQKKRNEIDNNYKWDLTTIYKSIDDWNKDYEDVKIELPKYNEFKGKLTESAQSYLNYLKFDEKINRKMYKLYEYAHLNFDSDTTNVEYQALKGKIEDLFTEYSNIKAFVSPELLSTDYKKIQEFENELDELKTYKHQNENFYRFQNHRLSEEQKKVMAVLSNTLSSPEELFESLTDSDMKFGNIKDENGNEVEFSESNWGVFNRSKDRMVRKNAFDLLYSTYSKYKNTLALTFSKNADYYIGMAKLENFKSSLEASLYGDKIDTKVYNNLIDTIHNNMDALHDYYDLKKNFLGLDELHLYDVYVDLVPNFDKKYSFEEAKELVFKAMSPLGSDYVDTLHKAFDEKWIDVYNNVGKRGGAYSSGFYDTNPFVLLNYEGRFEDVSTLAHELGHSMHSYFSWHNQEYCNSSYELFVAEVASTVNELFLRKYMLQHSNDIEEKKYILNSLLELFRTTIYRQVMFAEFERDMHAARENGEVLTNEYLCNKYYDLNKLYFGDNVCVDENIKYEWMRIPHFYYDFYVYKYAIGLSCACYIVNSILDGKENALENYRKFLTLGGSMYPSEELMVAGVDVTKSDVIESAIRTFRETMEEFRNLEKENKKRSR